MNRIQKRAFVKNIKKQKGLRILHTKGAFGRPPECEMQWRKEQYEKKARKFIEEQVENQEICLDAVVNTEIQQENHNI